MRLLALLGLALFFASHTHAQTISARIEAGEQSAKALASRFSAYEIITVKQADIDMLKTRPVSPGAFRLLLDDGNAKIILELRPNDLRSSHYRAVATTAKGEEERSRHAAKWFKGYANGDRSAPARFMIDENGPTGFFFDENRLRFIEPLQKYCPAQPGQLVLYDAASVLGPQVKCHAAELARYGIDTRHYQAAATAGGATKGLSLRIATQADYTYYLQKGAQTNDHILGVINELEGLYEKDFGITFEVTFQHVYETDTDPYTSTDALTLLHQFRDHWNANHTTVDRNIAFLFNVIDLPSGALGRAFQAQGCEERNSSYGFFSYSVLDYEAVIVAHEFGHMLGASHETPDACAADPSLMCAAVGRNAPFKFSQTAQAAISTYLQSHACFDDAIQVKAYPVPARTELMVECSMPGFSIILHDLLGRKTGEWTFAESAGSISTANISSGFYTLQVAWRSQVAVRRIEIVHP